VELVALDFKSGVVHVLNDDIGKAWHTPLGQVVFVRRDGGVFAAPFDMKKMAFATAPVPVLDGVRTGAFGAEFAMSPNGMLLYAAGAALGSAFLSEAVWVARDGKVAPVDSGWSFVGSNSFTMVLSPDGRRLALSIQAGLISDIWIKQLDKGPLTRLTFVGENDRPRWSADGRTVLYTSIAPGGKGNQDLHARRADGTGTDQLLLDHPRLITEIIPTRDTSRWIVRVGAPGSRDIMLWQRGSNELKPLIADAKASEGEPALSPDDRWLAYVSDESGRPEVYVRPFPNVDSGKWQLSRSGGSEPLWAHSGRELFYRDAGLNLVAVAVRPGAAFESAEQRTLFSTKDFQNNPVSRRVYEITPDDRRFLFARTVGGAATGAAGPLNLVRVDNWFTELGPRPRRP
jgi:serine/threonine-protein kinase